MSNHQTGNLRWLWLAIIVLLIDQLSKYYIRQGMIPGDAWGILPFLNITIAYNQGAAFSFLHDAGGWQQWLFSGIAILICIAIVIWLNKTPKSQHWQACALALILGGALGNLFDRLYYGFVTDFIDFYIGQWHWPTFNIADSAIVIGVIMLLIETTRKKST